MRGEKGAAEQIFRVLLQHALAVIVGVLQRRDGVGGLLLVEENRTALQLGVGAERAVGKVPDLVGVGGERVARAAELAVGFGEMEQRLLHAAIGGKGADEVSELAHRIGVTARVVGGVRAVEPRGGERERR